MVYNAIFNEKITGAGLGYRWHMHISYGEQLPDREEINVLLKHRTHGSRTLDISRVNYNPDEVKSVLDFLYGNFNGSAEIELLPDISADALESASTDPVVALHEYVKARIEEQRRG